MYNRGVMQSCGVVSQRWNRRCVRGEIPRSASNANDGSLDGPSLALIVDLTAGHPLTRRNAALTARRDFDSTGGVQIGQCF